MKGTTRAMADIHAVTEFTVERSKWYRGKGTSYTALQVTGGPAVDHGKMCCVGFLGKSCGLDETTLKQNAILTYIPEVLSNDKLKALAQNIHKSGIYEINDSNWLGPIERENQLIEEFDKLGIKLTFVD